MRRLTAGYRSETSFDMSLPEKLNDEVRAELLCYLVIGELVAMARTGSWLRTDHLVESSRSWLKRMERHFIGRIGLRWRPLPPNWRRASFELSR
jgi:hypothetical protein